MEEHVQGASCKLAIFQEDNAGLYKEARYTSWMTETFADLGWKIELQAPQGKTFIALFITNFIWNDYLFLHSTSIVSNRSIAILTFWTCTSFRRCRTASVPCCNCLTTQRPTKSKLGRHEIPRLLRYLVHLFLHTVS
jgi:hypothetical protein